MTVTKICVCLTYMVSLIWCATINSSGRQTEGQRVDKHESKAGQMLGFAHQWKRKGIAENTEPRPAGITENSQKTTGKKPISHELCRKANDTYYMKVHFISLEVPKCWCSGHWNSACRTEEPQNPLTREGSREWGVEKKHQLQQK